MTLTKNTPERNYPPEKFERVAVLRSAHGRADGHTYCTSASFVISPSGTRILAGRHLTARGILSPAELRQTAPVEPCLHCGRLLVKVGRRITIRCAEGRIATAYTCYRCEQAERVEIAA